MLSNPTPIGWENEEKPTQIFEKQQLERKEENPMSKGS